MTIYKVLEEDIFYIFDGEVIVDVVRFRKHYDWCVVVTRSLTKDSYFYPRRPSSELEILIVTGTTAKRWIEIREEYKKKEAYKLKEEANE